MLKGKLPSEVVSERHQFVNAMKQFVEQQKEKFQEILQQLGLTEESLSQVEPKQVCPHDPNHWVPEKSFKKHVEKCRLLKAGYQKDELTSHLLNIDFCYEGKSSMKTELDESLLNKIIWDDCVQSGEVYTGHRSMPVSHIDENINLTQMDRLAIYRYVVSKSHQAGKIDSVDQSDELLTTDWGSLVKKGLLDAQNNAKYSSKLEQLAALRDMKRRRQSYRAKNVHVTKKSYTEIIREVILNQMEMLIPADRKKHTRESDSEEHKSENRDRKRKERDVDQDSYSSRRYRSRSRDREKRRRYDEDRDKDREERNRRDDCYDLVSEPTKSTDFELVKKEPIPPSDHGDPAISKDSIHYVQSPSGENSGSSYHDEAKKARSPSVSSSQSSDRDHHRRHHNKSKHKKKSKHTKKHSKKHKR